MIDPARVEELFRRRNGGSPRLFAAPGRVNLIGEHTDYNEGFVLPMAIERETVVAAAPRADRRIVAYSMSLDEEVAFDLDRPGVPRRGGYVDYLEGVAREIEARGVRLTGADLAIDSDVPTGAGLSSSAALELAVGVALVSLAGQPLDRVALALAGQAAEHAYVGTRCGVMDQFIAALGQAGHALLIDCRSLRATPVPLEIGDATVVICDSQVKHALATSGYNHRRADCERGVELLRARLPGIRALRDVGAADLEAQRDVLPEVVLRRCRHVVSENDRTVAAAAALRRGDLPLIGELMAASHRSMRDDYEITCPEIDLLVELAAACPGVHGARMTGGGFGGSTVNLVARGAIDRFVATVGDGFAARFGGRPGFLTSRAADGARELLSPVPGVRS